MAATVTVACKIPNGLVLRVGEWETRLESVGGGMREIKQWQSRGAPVTVAGPAREIGRAHV